jgi:hypothetical protein
MAWGVWEDFAVAKRLSMRSVRYDQPVCSYTASHKATAHLNEATSDPMMRDGNMGTLELVGKPKPKGSGGANERRATARVQRRSL